MSKKPTHDILLAENYEAADDEEKAYFTNIGSAWQKDSGAISCEMSLEFPMSQRALARYREDGHVTPSPDWKPPFIREAV